MARLIYSLVLILAQPLIWLRLLWRARKQPAYLHHIGERYGFYPGTVPQKLFWLHAVSVGETRAAEPLIRALLDGFPEHSVLMTHTTPTGRDTGEELITRYGPRLTQAYLPYDLPGACRRFFSHFAPVCGVLMETEIWPNLIASAKRNAVPMLLANARLSERSKTGYRRFSSLIEPATASLVIAAQTAADAKRLEEIGARRVHVFGNLKFDVTPSPEKQRLGGEWRKALGDRRVWLAASTREGEEALILDAFARTSAIEAIDPPILLVLVPRHPQRFDEVAAMIEARNLRFCRRGKGEFPDAKTRVWLGDSMGEMPAYYTAADIALIGGTLLPFGGQNLIEAAACACPTLVGTHTFNFAQAAEDAVVRGAARRVSDADDAAREALRLLDDDAALSAMREASALFAREHRGATEKTVELIRNQETGDRCRETENSCDLRSEKNL
ncbi:MAG: lipid IV(A) 3-deoxy-D-manno-octulosonic acid transferase [Candidatus Accumulibacter sp.]|jgi:3-deoxy-D-manno-octulosonic-acid transferase|nr:lipid IV(A) 3-deoxy-D-manno-octulosonic acid transferase [Accumulibacter sp.]